MLNDPIAGISGSGRSTFPVEAAASETTRSSRFSSWLTQTITNAPRYLSDATEYFFKPLYLRRASVAVKTVAPDSAPDVSRLGLESLVIRPETRDALFFAAFADILKYKTPWGLKTSDGDSSAFIPANKQKKNPFLDMIRNGEIATSAFAQLLKQDKKFPLYLESLPSLNTDFHEDSLCFYSFILEEAERLYNSGMPASKALSAALNEHIDQALQELDNGLTQGKTLHDSLFFSLIQAPLGAALALYHSIVWLFGHSYPDKLSFDEFEFDANRNLFTRPGLKEFGQLRVYSGNHAFVELIKNGEKTGRAIGKYPKYRGLPAAEKANEQKQCYAVNQFELPPFNPADFTLNTIWNQRYIPSWRSGTLSTKLVGIPGRKGQLAFPPFIATAEVNKFVMYDQRHSESAQLINERRAYVNANIPLDMKPAAQFALSETEFGNISDHLDRDIEDCRNGADRCNFNLWNNNCVDYTQSIYKQTPYPGHYQDYVEGASVPEQLYVWSKRETSTRFGIHLAGTAMLIFTIAPVVVKVLRGTASLLKNMVKGIMHCLPFYSTPIEERSCKKVKKPKIRVSKKHL